MKSDAELNLIIATTIITVISFSYACIRFDSEEKMKADREAKKRIEEAQRKK